MKDNPITTKHAFERTLDQLIVNQNELKKLEDQQSTKIVKVRSQYDPKISSLCDTIVQQQKRCQEFATAHKEELFPNSTKSGETNQCRYGFRLGKPTLKPIGAGNNWAKIKDAIVEGGKRLQQFLITANKPDKTQLIKCKEVHEELGVKVVQEQRFFVESK